MRIEIKARVTGVVLFSFEAEINSVRITLGAGVKARANLARADLAGADLAGADLAGADLAGAYLAGANLARADLAGADLAGANLAGANLAGANLAGADLVGANLADANLERANLARADLAGADLAGADLAGANLARAENLPVASHDEIARLDQVREIVLADEARLDMSTWHGSRWDPTHTPEEERGCGTPHCIVGWLQALSPDVKIRSLDPRSAGELLAPASAYMFTQSTACALQWFTDRLYARKPATEAA